MQQNFQNSLIAQRFLSKNKKYYKNSPKKDKKNQDPESCLAKDISSIMKKLQSQNLPNIQRHSKHQSAYYSQRSPKTTKIYTLANCNSLNFFDKQNHLVMERKDLQKQIRGFIKKMRCSQKSKSSMYQEYSALWQETNDYLEYYLINYAGEESGKASQLLKKQGKTVILLVLKKKYKCFQPQYNSQDIIHRIILAFNLNPLNDFQFISWEQFIRIKKLISHEFSKKEGVDFLINYFFSRGSNKQLTGSQFWSIFFSPFRKINSVSDSYALDHLLNRIVQLSGSMIEQSIILTRQSLRKIILENSMFLWQQFVILAFI